MPKRRMFSNEIVRSDAFLDLPVSSRELYFQLGMDTDDRGYIPNAKSIIRLIGANQGDLEPLIAKGFLMIRGETLILQKHFGINNIIRHDRFHETEYLEDLKKLFIKDNGSYTEDKNQGKPMVNILGIPNGNQKTTDTNTTLIQYNTNSNTYSNSDTNLIHILIDGGYISKGSSEEDEINEYLERLETKESDLEVIVKNFIKSLPLAKDIEDKVDYFVEFVETELELPF